MPPRTHEAAFLQAILGELKAIRALLERHVASAAARGEVKEVASPRRRSNRRKTTGA